MFNLRALKNHDYIITICIGILAVLSLMLIYSTTINATTAEGGAGTFSKQLFFFIIGSLIYFALSTFDLSWLRNRKLIGVFFAATLLSLIYVKLFTPEVANTNRWINVFGFNIQPAEYAKITIVLTTAALFGLKEDEIVKEGINLEKNDSATIDNSLKTRINNTFRSNYKYLISIISITAVSLLIFIQPAFGNTVIITFIWLSLMFAISSKQEQIAALVIPVILIPLFMWNVWGMQDIFNNIYAGLFIIFVITIIINYLSKTRYYLVFAAILIGLSLRPAILTVWDTEVISDYQKQRIETYFQTPENDPLDAGYQVRQSKIAVGSGQFTGRGYLQGTQSTLQVLPFAHTDFIFAALAEQFGFIGSLLLLGVYTTIIYRIIRAGLTTQDEFTFIISIGIISLLLLNIFINIGMNLGKLPVTGVPLPLVSYGGSSVLVNMIALGLIQSINTTITSKDISESFAPNTSPWR
ncbi:hypothetical protein GF389_04335 [Candidatus Dojkabacteria bacterium]|nr:hypothetical protein [Candidatus Dojkabacteria bacterium]